MGFGVFFAFAIIGLVALTGYLVGFAVMESETGVWGEELAHRLEMKEDRLRWFVDTGDMFASNSYVSTAMVDVGGRSSYLPRELENMTKARGVEFAGIIDFSGRTIALSTDFPEAGIDANQLRYVIETGRDRMWCYAPGKIIFAALPINYYNTPQGALVIVTSFKTIDAGVGGTEDGSGVITDLCGDTIVNERGKAPAGRHIKVELIADREHYPMAHMLSLKLTGSVALEHVLAPAIRIVMRLGLLGLVFLIGGVLVARRIERELITAKDLALESSRARSQFLANMSHEIRTPLNGALGNVNLLLEENLTPSQKVLAQDAKLSGQTLLELLNDILDFSKIDAGFMKLEVAPVNARKLAETVERSYHTVLNEKQLTCEVRVDEKVPEVIMGDALRLRQILNNLFSNAIKFTPSGSVNLSVSVDSAGETILFSVKDSGIGISADKVGKLFSPFMQAESNTTRRFGGTGLGLSICRDLAHLMGGEVEVDSQVGKGSEFTLLVPLVAADQEFKSRGAEATSTAAAPDAIEPLSVLLVEDNAVNRTLMTKLLAKYGHTVDVAVNGLEALEMVGSINYDLIFMDCQMPVMDGYEATRKIREKRGPHRPRIVALTANAFKEDQESCFEVGMDDFVTKPVSRESLEKIMRSAKKRSA